MRIDLSALAARANPGRRKRTTTLRDIIPPATLATDLYRATFLNVVTMWQRYTTRILAEYERSLSALTTDSPADLNRVLDEASGEFNRLLLLLTPALRSWVLRVERWERGKFIGAVLSASRVDLSTLIGPEDVAQTLEQVIEWNTNLIRDVNDQARQKIANAVFSGLTGRRPAADVAKEIRSATGFARDRSMRIASHQLSSLSSQLAAERRRAAGLDVWEWRHSAKLHPRREHLARDGNLYTDNPDRVGEVVEGKTVMASPPADDQPGIPPFCGCRSRAVLTFS
ncbi:hypothetical protein [Sphingomonas abaci]|uniref:Phage head morphogenesis domain-containing protein n=1 Tax=Sphingomonas abaci TaxID=237611 RepID=A0A7W7AIN3_9SPHN|nr:hypothetical protein [Sphingomonas abaci]MBB4616920.1 hypothetical protein [Sphingomonas abaci]